MFGWLKSHWRDVVSMTVSAAVATAVFAGVLALTVGTGGLGLPLAAGLLIAAGSSGVVGGATGYLLDGWLNKKAITAMGAIKAAAVSGLLSVATVGVLRAGGPVLARVAGPIVGRAAPVLS